MSNIGIVYVSTNKINSNSVLKVKKKSNSMNSKTNNPCDKNLQKGPYSGHIVDRLNLLERQQRVWPD